MTGTLICWDGRRVVLPDLTSWRMEYACGIPCDSFYLECLWEPARPGRWPRRYALRRRRTGSGCLLAWWTRFAAAGTKTERA